MFLAAAAAACNCSPVPWIMVAVLAGLVVFLVGFFGSQKDKPTGLGLGFYPALFLGAGGGSVTAFGLLTFFVTVGLI